MCIKSEARAFFFKHATSDQSHKTFLLPSKNCHQGLSPLALGYILTCMKQNKKSYKIMRQKQSFWNKIMGIIKALKCCQNVYQIILCLCRTCLKLQKSAKFLFLPRTSCQVSVTGPLVLWFNSFHKFSLFSHGNQSNSEIWTKMICLVESYSRNISVKFCQNTHSERAINAIFHFPPVSLKTVSHHSNQSSYLIQIKNAIICSPRPIDAICEIW